jgi:osmotically inducible lipoprotein OsmB
MKTTQRLAAILATLAMLPGLGACSGMSQRDQSTTAGAVVGGVLGNVITGGSTTGTVGGAAVGGIIGNQVGKPGR